MKMSKICNNCGKTLENNINVCPYCNSTDLRVKNELTKENNDIVHRLFYYSYPEGKILSKSKTISIAVFLFFFISWLLVGAHPIFIMLSLLFALIALLIGMIVHRFKHPPSALKIRNNDYGLGEDLKNLLFFWQDEKGNYVPSKTKLISFVLFIAGFVVGLFTVKPNPVFGGFILGVVFEIPAFAVGYVIHRQTHKDDPVKEIPPQPKQVEVKKEIPQPKSVIPEYEDYKKQLDELDSKFASKEKSARELIENRFEPPQLTYTRFIGGVDKSKKLFKKQYNSALTMINLADEYSPRIASELESKINILKTIIEKIDDLTNELVLTEDISKKEDVDNLMSEMDDLIDSVKKY